MKKRTKFIILGAMIVLLGVTGYLNIYLNNSVKQTSGTTVTTSYFTSYRNDRSSTRDQELLYYDAIIESESSTEAAVTAAYDAKLKLIQLMDDEMKTEGLIKGLGFSDCVISVGDPKVTVVVQSDKLTEGEVAQIAACVMDKLNVTLKNIVVMCAE